MPESYFTKLSAAASMQYVQRAPQATIPSQVGGVTMPKAIAEEPYPKTQYAPPANAPAGGVESAKPTPAPVKPFQKTAGELPPYVKLSALSNWVTGDSTPDVVDGYAVHRTPNPWHYVVPAATQLAVNTAYNRPGLGLLAGAGMLAYNKMTGEDNTALDYGLNLGAPLAVSGGGGALKQLGQAGMQAVQGNLPQARQTALGAWNAYKGHVSKPTEMLGELKSVRNIFTGAMHGAPAGSLDAASRMQALRATGRNMGSAMFHDPSIFGRVLRSPVRTMAQAGGGSVARGALPTLGRMAKNIRGGGWLALGGTALGVGSSYWGALKADNQQRRQVNQARYGNPSLAPQYAAT